MADIDRIIEQIVAASRAKAGRAFSSSKVYGSEPILMRGSQLASYLPEPIRQMRALARRPEARSWTEARLFVEQARLMAKFEDDCPYHGTFQSYFPTYDVMDNQQLRGYFTWRSQIRRATVEKTSASFAYVYLYELINGIGAAPGETAFRAIESFWKTYRKLDQTLDRYVRPWLVDYAVYHDLDPALALPYADVAHDRAVDVLERAQSRALAQAPARGSRREPRPYGQDISSDERLLEALDELSTHRLAQSRLCRDEPDAVREVTRGVFDRLVRHYHGGRSQDLVESLFGARRAMPHLMFASAVFYPGGRHPDCVYRLGETRVYECRGGIWTCTARHDGGGRSARLGQALRAVDRQLRDALDYPHPLKERGDPKYLTQLVDREIKDYLAWRSAHAPVRVEIDLGKLEGIRSAAAMTREALLVDEERAEEPTPVEEPAPEGAAEAPVSPAAPESSGQSDAPALSREERALLDDLLAGRPPQSASPDLLVDSINEKLLDLVGDTVLEFDDTGAPSLVEDYLDDVRAMM
ncbi:TerB N-terminal domain-containing protein [Olsenella sp. An293]|uniref:TerB N-terminal domain-containing protein n=1 Tax=Olsenella sp. An293 TaxID=1965626 RepID=UPI000B38CB95|nr:TerB N-terminal domain-containing protein [Olsenella sp. An293]OUO32097.1 hypothetical protein B5F85_08100 [Olsenella sp. An293]